MALVKTVNRNKYLRVNEFHSFNSKLAKSDLLVKIIAVAVIVVDSQVTSRAGRNELGS